MTEHPSANQQETRAGLRSGFRQRPEVVAQRASYLEPPVYNPDQPTTKPESSWGFIWDEKGQKIEVFGTVSEGNNQVTRREKVDHAVGILQPGKIEL